MSPPANFWELSPGTGGAAPSGIAKSCANPPTFGAELKGDGSCCVQTCGCWCIAFVAYNRVMAYSFPSNCTDCMGLSAHHADTIAASVVCPPGTGYGSGDVINQNVQIGAHTGGCGGSLISIPVTLVTTGGFVMIYTDATYDVYANITFQNTGVPCDGTNPCYTDVNVPHRHVAGDGITCPNWVQTPFVPDVIL